MDRLGWCCRRRFLQLAGSAGLLAASSRDRAFAQGNYQAMLLSCIDPRMVAPVYKYMDQRGLTGQYSQFVIAGAAIAVVAPSFETWRPAFWDNLAATIQLHHITAIAVRHGSPMARRASPTRRPRPRPTARRSRNLAERSASATPSS